jgi:hypothetical protein
MRQDRRHLRSAQHDRKTARHARPNDPIDVPDVFRQHDSVQKQDRSERLILRGLADVTSGSQRRDELRDVFGAQLGRMPQMVVGDEAADPHRIGFLGPPAGMSHANRPPHTIHQSLRR